MEESFRNLLSVILENEEEIEQGNYTKIQINQELVIKSLRSLLPSKEFNLSLSFKDAVVISKFFYDKREFELVIKLIGNFLKFQDLNLNSDIENYYVRLWQFLAMSHLNLEHYYEAIFCIRKTFLYLSKVVLYKERIFDSIAQVYSRIGSIQDAEHFFFESLKIKREKMDILGISVSYGGLASNFIKGGSWKRALACIRILKYTSQKTKNEYGIFLANTLSIQIFNESRENTIFLDNEIKDRFEVLPKKYSLQIASLIDQNQKTIKTDYLRFGNQAYISFLLEATRAQIFFETISLSSLDKLREELELRSPNSLASFNRLLGFKAAKENKFLDAFTFLEIAESLYSSSELHIEAINIIREKAKLFFYLKKREQGEAELIKAIKKCESLNLENLAEAFEKELKEKNELSWVKVKLQRYVGTNLTNNFLLGGQLNSINEATISFSDLRDFTKISESLSDESLIDFLNHYFNAMTKIIHENNGYVDKYIGDAILFVNHLYSNTSSHAGDAIRIALSMKEELKFLNIKFVTMGLPEIKIGIGIHSGKIFSGMVGPISRREYTVIGDTVNTSSRLESISKKYGFPIIISEESINQIKEKEKVDFLIVEIDEILVKGKEQSLKIFTAFQSSESTTDVGKDCIFFDRAYESFKNKKFLDALEFLEKITTSDFNVLRTIYKDRISNLQNYPEQKLDKFFYITKYNDK